MKIIHLFFVIIILLTSTSCWGNRFHVDRVDIIRCLNDTISGEDIGLVPGAVFELREDIDLGGKVFLFPLDVTIKARGGVIKNGIIVGCNTRVLYNDAVFNNVTIEGTWLIPVIKSSLFKDLSYENSLKDVIALTNPGMHNKVIIHKGTYIVNTEKNEEACLTLNNNTELILEGIIQIKPNAYTDYDIIRVEGENITIKGNGVIIGDKFAHLSKDGEWGMGIRVQKSRKISIKGLTVKNCWGDCIYVGRGSTNVIIERCLLDHGRRQGISITKADSVLVKNCKITNVGGTAPEYAIDVEPNAGESADQILIDNVEIINCKGGFLAYGRAANAMIGNVTFKNCKLVAIERLAACFIKCDKVVFEQCQIKRHKNEHVIWCENIDYLLINNNHFRYDHVVLGIKKIAKKLLGRDSKDAVVINNCNNCIFNNRSRE